MFEGQYATDPNIATRAKYSDYMRGTPTASGYLTSPIFHAGLSKWDPTSDYQTKAEGIVGGDIRGANVLNTGIGTLTPEPYSPSSPNYNPRNWGHEFGHEASHAGWDYDTPYDQAAGEIGNFVTKIYDMSKGDYEGGEEEMLNRMHDYMYGDYKDPMIFGPTGFLRRQGYLNPNKINQMGFQTGWSDKGREAIKRSHVVDWQKGMLLQGPDSARGQIALGQRPDQVRAQGEAYMSPDRGNVQAPRMTSSQIRQEADRTGGTRHAGEMTQAAGRVRGPHGYQRGGSVNPFEETRQAARDWSPREQYISRSNQDRTQDASINRFIREGQGNQQRWEQGGGQGAYPVFNEPGTGANFPVSPGWLQASSGRDNSGVMLALANSPAINKTKNIYSRVDPFFPEVDVGDQQIGYDFNKNLWGGTLGFGGGYDIDDEDYNAYINWGTNW